MGVLKARVGGAWQNIGNGGGLSPAGGVAGDVLLKMSATAFDAVWGTTMPKLKLTPGNVVGLDQNNPALQIGEETGQNLIGYWSGLMSRNNGAAATLRLNYYGGVVSIGGGNADQFPNNFQVSETAHATSRRAAMWMGNGWTIGQDYAANGVKDFYIYQVANSRQPLWIHQDGRIVGVGDWCLGAHPNQSSYPAMWKKAYGATPGVGQYTFLAWDVHAVVNAEVGGVVASRINNTTRLSVANNEVVIHGIPTKSDYNPPNTEWNTAHFFAYPTAANYYQARMAFHSPGVAPQVRAVATSGDKIGIINTNGTVFAPIEASAFTVGSTITEKHGIRSLREYEPIAVSHDPYTDTVPQPDIMSLRPIAFRPKTPALRIIPLDGDDEYTPERHQIVPEIGILGHEGTRERLGLIAEEVESVVPSAVTHDMYGNCIGIDYAQVTVALLDHVQQLTERIELLEARLA